jgi:hypothetical protein
LLNFCLSSESDALSSFCELLVDEIESALSFGKYSSK